jgi:uncharacterized protein with FMN-binding domain
MSVKASRQPFRLGRTIRKYFVSGFVIFTFIAYALHERSINSDGGANTLAPAPTAVPARQARIAATPIFPAPTAIPRPTVTPLTQSAPASAPPPTQSPTQPPAQPAPTMTPPPPAVAAGQYRDGEYTGPSVDANWGLVQVKAVIQRGRLTDVQFLQYPNDRRTSQRINSIVMPYLQTEAIQAQSANVDLITGATLTSEAFAESLQAALDSARNGM